MNKLISHILRIEKYIFRERSLPMFENHVLSKIPDGVSFVEVDSQNIDDVREFRGESVLREFRKFYAAGFHGVYAYLEGVVIGHTWMEINETKVPRLSQEGFLLLPGECGGWYAHVDKKCRGKRIVAGMRKRSNVKAKSLGCKKRIGHVLQDNEAALHSSRRSGGIVYETRAIVLKTGFRLIIIYKSDDRWFVFLRLLWFRNAIVIAWSKAYKFSFLLAKL